MSNRKWELVSPEEPKPAKPARKEEKFDRTAFVSKPWAEPSKVPPEAPLTAPLAVPLTAPLAAPPIDKAAPTTESPPKSAQGEAPKKPIAIEEPRYVQVQVLDKILVEWNRQTKTMCDDIARLERTVARVCKPLLDRLEQKAREADEEPPRLAPKPKKLVPFVPLDSTVDGSGLEKTRFLDRPLDWVKERDVALDANYKILGKGDKHELVQKKQDNRRA